MSDLVKKYFQGAYSANINVFTVLSDKLDSLDLTSNQLQDLNKLLHIFFLGQLVGLPTLGSILEKFGVSSNYKQIKYKKLCNSLSMGCIRRLFEAVFSEQVSHILQSMVQKDASCWSRELVTLVLDDSVFRGWFQSQDASQDFEDCYGKFFSGQFNASVYGFKVVTLGMSIDGIFYPLFFDFVKKQQPNQPKPKTAVEVAKKLITRWGNWKKELHKNNISLPKLHLSCDSGYSDMGLSKVCKENGICYISVPKKSHFFEIDGQKYKLKDWITERFISEEQEHLAKQQSLPDEEKTPFYQRIRANYCSKKEDVTLLIFRLNGSKKVTVIYTTNKYVFAKTLRRHWFQRTYIEQFFKILKHVLKIGEARTRQKKDFEIKLLRFAFIAVHVQQIVRFLRKKIPEFKGKGFIAIQRLLNSYPEFLDLLQSKLKVRA